LKLVERRFDLLPVERTGIDQWCRLLTREQQRASFLVSPYGHFRPPPLPMCPGAPRSLILPLGPAAKTALSHIPPRSALGRSAHLPRQWVPTLSRRVRKRVASRPSREDGASLRARRNWRLAPSTRPSHRSSTPRG